MATSRSPVPLHCARGDARCNGARLVRALEAAGVPGPFFLYGSEASVSLCAGARERLSPGREDRGDVWGRVKTFLAAHHDRHVFGFFGFDLNGGPGDARASPFPDCWLGVADLALLVGPSSWTALGAVPVLTDVPACTCGDRPVHYAAGLDRSRPDEYRRTVEAALAWVGGDPRKRMTVARRLSLPSVDMLRSVSCIPSACDHSRSFYLDLGELGLTGQCPEVLMVGDREGFVSYKLSGTFPRSDDPAADDVLRRQFQVDPKNLAEHANSAASFGMALSGLGAVTSTGPEVLDLRQLRHLMTRFQVAYSTGCGVADGIRAVLPLGVAPAAGGYHALMAAEAGARGPFYGLVGLIEPGGAVSMTQVLRTVYRAQDEFYSWVGAAVTSQSTPDGEWTETMIKLGEVGLILAD
ncbi:chorismate-binding protein [Emcibacter sp. SYSU 3D8]|uniref:chorismate-binding protein n=1 Tax=Emcibacter sp. SYSU 3D8 TaxID=3133969 RepID=UPI0031FE5EF9